ncbi:hypothetical protein N7495_009863 [Penicillium taxi]|uniref:uncharacterized protein n=1 Tax=Penicillium taxi TaxID=168475 RepID=UPI00254557A6|nr:uncharacterized protein N7495_009863 [Penicillium taxi]KAJ5885353.1 hypothetical protein N7495_009863 [Penicillium taxi]
MDHPKPDIFAMEDVHEDSPVAQQQKFTRLLLKLDMRILPVLSLLFLCSFLDRTNVGNAKIIGLEADIQITDHQYQIGLALPSNLVLKKASPKIWLPFLTVTWGIITMCLGFVQNYAGFVAVRALLGVAEAGLLPGTVLYLSTFYRRKDLALRIGLFYTAASLSGAFGGKLSFPYLSMGAKYNPGNAGLLARGLAEIAPRGGLEGWRWIFIIEGLLTFLCGVVSFFVLPNAMNSAKFLTAEERELGREMLMLDHPKQEEGSSVTAHEESFQWSEVRRGILDPQVWLSASTYFAILAGLYSFGLFLPTIIKNLGFAKDANEVQLWSVIPYAVAAVITVVVAFISDRLRLRGIVMLFTLPIAIIGYAVIASVDHPHVQYGMTFLMATGLYASVPCVLVWLSNNSAGHYKRATTSALQLAIANAGGFVATFSYSSHEGSQFRRSHITILGLLVFAWFMILFNVLYCAKVNRDKQSGKYDCFVGYNDDRNPEFKLVL